VTSLEVLRLESNQITGAIPPGLGRLTALRELSLGFNLLSGEIPRELGNCLSSRSWI